MIKLDVQSYCDECSCFEADVEEPVRYYSGNDAICSTDTIVRCVHRRKCTQLVRYLARQMEKKD